MNPGGSLNRAREYETSGKNFINILLNSRKDGALVNCIYYYIIYIRGRYKRAVVWFFFRILIKYCANVISDNTVTVNIIVTIPSSLWLGTLIIFTFKFQEKLYRVSKNIKLYQKRSNHHQRYIIFEMKFSLGIIIFFQ